MKRMRVCFLASSGGHLEELLGLTALIKAHDAFIVTEKRSFSVELPVETVYFVMPVDRNDRTFPLRLIWIAIQSLLILLRERPQVVVSTGALMTVPMSLLAKMMGAKLIFIESITRVHSTSATGRLMYKYADLLIIQWESLRAQYPNAVYRGRII